MSETNVLVNFRLDKDQPLRLKWLATDGVPGDGYKAQITAIKLMDGHRLAMDKSSILEQTVADPSGGIGGYLMTFNGMVGFAADHPDRPRLWIVHETDKEQLDSIIENSLRSLHDWRRFILSSSRLIRIDFLTSKYMPRAQLIMSEAKQLHIRKIIASA